MDIYETQQGLSTHGPLQLLLFLARAALGRIQGGAKQATEGPLLQQTSSSDRKATSTNRMHSSDLEVCGKKCCYFWFHCEAKFLTLFWTSGLSHFWASLLDECHCWWTSESPRARVTKFYSRLWLIRSVRRASKFFVFKLIKIVILWVYYTIPFGFSLFWHFLVVTFQLFILHVLLRINDEGSVPEMRIWSISLIYSDLKWCIHLRRSLYLNFYQDV